MSELAGVGAGVGGDIGYRYLQWLEGTAIRLDGWIEALCQVKTVKNLVTETMTLSNLLVAIFGCLPLTSCKPISEASAGYLVTSNFHSIRLLDSGC